MESDCCCTWFNVSQNQWLRRGFWLMLVAVVGVIAATGCAGMEHPTSIPMKTPTPDPTDAPTNETGSPAYMAGKDLFNKNCSACHGSKATGSDAGPPLIHEVYLPYHHPDFSFHAAVNKGVRAHHWYFGDMPPVPGLTDEDVDNVICYVRSLQKQSGVPVETSC